MPQELERPTHTVPCPCPAWPGFTAGGARPLRVPHPRRGRRDRVRSTSARAADGRRSRASSWTRTVELQVNGPPPFVSRGGVKLATRWTARSSVAVRHCARRRRLDRRLHRLPAAARGGARVALDVAYGELDWRLREDARVIVIQRTNAAPRRPTAASADRTCRVDISFISLHKVLPPCWRCAAAGSTASRWSSRSSRSAGTGSARAASSRSGPSRRR